MSSGQEEVVLNRVLTIPNLISFTRMLLIPLFAWAFLTGGKDPFALVLLVVIGSTDWVDGYVARRTGQVSRLGKLLDPVADRMAIVVVLLALVFRDAVAAPVAGAILLRDAIVSIVFPILEARGFPRIAVNKTGKWATALIFTGMAFASASVLESVRDFARPASSGLLLAGAILYWVAGVFYVRELQRLVALRRAA
ncbi:MAG TPA: CDP-alcohol phosphatidyltransferase family protein [Actinomycetota bacterium]|nr:CDP-alcohol phosphatidyltransferase family protein [Actinomycetota bacterium]